MSNPILTTDLRQLGLNHAQLNVSGVWQWVSWEPAGPKAFDLWTLYFYKEFGNDRVEIKTGYNSNDIEFVGMQVDRPSPRASTTHSPSPQAIRSSSREVC